MPTAFAASSGAHPLPEAFVRTVEEVCRRHGILLVLDEVATGFGRTGRMFASELYDLQPDVLALSKGINSGYLPLGATLFREELYDAYQRTGTLLFHGETQGGNPAACAAALATLDVLEDEGLARNAAAVGGDLLDRLRELERHPHVARCAGPACSSASTSSAAGRRTSRPTCSPTCCPSWRAARRKGCSSTCGAQRAGRGPDRGGARPCAGRAPAGQVSVSKPEPRHS